MSSIPPDVEKKIEEILESKVGVNVKIDAIVGCFKDRGLAYKSCLLPKDILCHPANRAGHMVSEHDCWLKGEKMLKVGIQKSVLEAGGSACFEMSTEATARKQQFEKILGKVQRLSSVSVVVFV